MLVENQGATMPKVELTGLEAHIALWAFDKVYQVDENGKVPTFILG